MKKWVMVYGLALAACFIGPGYAASSCCPKVSSSCSDSVCCAPCDLKTADVCTTTTSSSSSSSCNTKKNCNKDCDSDCAFFRSIFVPRSMTTDSTLELAQGNYFFYHHAFCPEDRAFFNLQASYFHRESRNQCELATYFIGKPTISVKEEGTGDIGSLWLDLIGPVSDPAGQPPFQFIDSTVSIAPKRKVDGGYFNFLFDFTSWCSGTWLGIAFAVAKVKHDLGLRTTSVNGVEGTIGDIKTAADALNNPAWTAGKFSRCVLEDTRVDDVQIKLGWNYYFCNMDHLGVYFVGTAPTGCVHRNEYIFEPAVGSRHGSVGVGLNTDYTLWECGNQALNWMLDLKYQYFLSRCERRSFDLCQNGPLSRYLQVVTEDSRQFTMPGINHFTLNVDVTPKSQFQLWTAFNWFYCCFNFEAGYNLWWRDDEDLCLKCNLPGNIGIYDMSGECSNCDSDPAVPGTNLTSASKARICETICVANPNNAVPSDASFVQLTNADINLTSGAAPRALTNTIYGAFGYQSDVWCMPVFAGVGASYEWARCNTAFEQWTVWLRSFIAF